MKAPEKNNNHSMDDLLAKYLLQEVTEDERRQAEQWINADEVQRKYFEQFKTIWMTAAGQAPADTPDEEDAWQRFQQRLKGKTQQQVAPVTVVKNKRARWIAAAAILLVLIAGSWMVHYIRYGPSRMLLTLDSKNSILTDTLPDGTLVTLNKNSRLSYPPEFSPAARTVQLQGEAFFKIAGQQDHPFIVQVNKVTVTVLGTSFNIKSAGSSTNIIVETGKVEVQHNGQAVRLTAHEMASVSKRSGKISKSAVAGELYNYYVTRSFICNNTPLRELVSALNDAYHADIIIADPKLGNLPITTTFKDESLDTILTIITQTFSDITFTKKGQRIILK